MSGDYDKVNRYHSNENDKDNKLESELPRTSQIQGFNLDTRTLMQTKHDATEVFLARLYSSTEIQFYYLLSTGLSLAAAIYLFVTEGTASLFI